MKETLTVIILLVSLKLFAGVEAEERALQLENQSYSNVCSDEVKENRNLYKQASLKFVDQALVQLNRFKKYEKVYDERGLYDLMYFKPDSLSDYYEILESFITLDEKISLRSLFAKRKKQMAEMFKSSSPEQKARIKAVKLKSFDVFVKESVDKEPYKWPGSIGFNAIVAQLACDKSGLLPSAFLSPDEESIVLCPGAYLHARVTGQGVESLNFLVAHELAHLMDSDEDPEAYVGLKKALQTHNMPVEFLKEMSADLLATRFFSSSNEVSDSYLKDNLSRFCFRPEVLEGSMVYPSGERRVHFILNNLPLKEIREYEDVLGDFEHYQTYLKPAPLGVDMYYAWGFPGGRGQGVRIVDLEMGWNKSHREFRPPFLENKHRRNIEHGTQVWGVLAAKNDGVGVTGMVSNAEIGLWGVSVSGGIKQWKQNIFAALRDLKNRNVLKAGDVFLIEVEAGSGPNERRTPIEYWDEAFNIIKYFTDMGVIVVEAAANGGQNLDDPRFSNKFKRASRDSGAILVAAGSAPVKESAYKKHFVKHLTSNYGSRIDTFNYGERVATAGYGDLHLTSGDGEDSDYHDDFGGTSSAAAITAGLVGSLVGIAKAQGRLLEPLEVREALRNTGLSPHKTEDKEIGTYPNMPELLKYLNLVK